MRSWGALGTARPWVIGLSLLMFVGIFAFRLEVDDPKEPISFLMVVPIGLLAAELGLVGGLLGATLASSLVVSWDMLTHPDLSALGYSTRFIVFFASGATVGLLISRRREVEAESLRWFEQSLDLNCIADFEGRFVRVNGAFEETLGYRPRDLLTTPYIDFVHPDDVEKTQAATLDLFEGRELVDFENRYRADDGTYRWLQWSANVDLGRRLIYATARDVTEQKGLQEKLETLAQNDSLTGLLNRRHFEAEATKQIEFIDRYGPGAALFMFDIDRFKSINDSLGHGAGDEALNRVAAAMRARVRSTDVCARIGGDEFAIMCPGMGRDGAGALATGLLNSIRGSVLGSGDQTFSVTSSLGIALYVPPAETNLQELLASADRAMYIAKRAGGDRFAFDEQHVGIPVD